MLFDYAIARRADADYEYRGELRRNDLTLESPVRSCARQLDPSFRVEYGGTCREVDDTAGELYRPGILLQATGFRHGGDECNLRCLSAEGLPMRFHGVR
jgi:hypothetical protein